MSGGFFCECHGTRAERMEHWEITAYRCNYSAFNGYRYTPSRYSEVHCKKCGQFWRTKAAYVRRLPIAPQNPFL